MTHPDSRTFRADIKMFLVTVHGEAVSIFIKDVSGTHYSRLYIILSVPNGTAEPTSWVYEMFSNFSSDNEGRKRSMEIAHKDLVQVRSELQKNGFIVHHGEGLGYTKWRVSLVHKTSQYF